jgi:adenylyltransferase/sulfurtransferase
MRKTTRPDQPTPGLSDPDDRYSRQTILPFIGRAGQDKIRHSHVAILGCGALGSVSATLLCRAGIGRMTLIDRDIVEPSNLQRQLLFCEADIGRSKVAASAEALKRIRSDLVLTTAEEHLDHRNAEALLTGADLFIDGCDNFHSRMILNDVAVKLGIPWVYGGVVAGEGVTMPISPGGKPCLRCLLPDLPPVGSSPTCETAGILNSASTVIAAQQTALALRFLTGGSPSPLLTALDLWENRQHQIDIPADPDCPCCGHHRYDFLGQGTARVTVPLCSRAVQLLPERGLTASLEQLRDRLAPLTAVQGDSHLLRFCIEGEEITLFADGRAIFKGSGDPKRCRALYARYIGE